MYDLILIAWNMATGAGILGILWLSLSLPKVRR